MIGHTPEEVIPVGSLWVFDEATCPPSMRFPGRPWRRWHCLILRHFSAEYELGGPRIDMVEIAVTNTGATETWCLEDFLSLALLTGKWKRLA